MFGWLGGGNKSSNNNEQQSAGSKHDGDAAEEKNSLSTPAGEDRVGHGISNNASQQPSTDVVPAGQPTSIENEGDDGNGGAADSGAEKKDSLPAGTDGNETKLALPGTTGESDGGSGADQASGLAREAEDSAPKAVPEVRVRSGDQGGDANEEWWDGLLAGGGEAGGGGEGGAKVEWKDEGDMEGGKGIKEESVQRTAEKGEEAGLEGGETEANGKLQVMEAVSVDVSSTEMEAADAHAGRPEEEEVAEKLEPTSGPEVTTQAGETAAETDDEGLQGFRDEQGTSTAGEDSKESEGVLADREQSSAEGNSLQTEQPAVPQNGEGGKGTPAGEDQGTDKDKKEEAVPLEGVAGSGEERSQVDEMAAGKDAATAGSSENAGASQVDADSEGPPAGLTALTRGKGAAETTNGSDSGGQVSQGEGTEGIKGSGRIEQDEKETAGGANANGEGGPGEAQEKTADVRLVAPAAAAQPAADVSDKDVSLPGNPPTLPSQSPQPSMSSFRSVESVEVGRTGRRGAGAESATGSLDSTAGTEGVSKGSAAAAAAAARKAAAKALGFQGGKDEKGQARGEEADQGTITEGSLGKDDEGANHTGPARSPVERKRIDRRHHLMKEIVKIQQDREAYEKQVQAASIEKSPKEGAEIAEEVGDSEALPSPAGSVSAAQKLPGKSLKDKGKPSEEANRKRRIRTQEGPGPANHVAASQDARQPAGFRDNQPGFRDGQVGVKGAPREGGRGGGIGGFREGSGKAARARPAVSVTSTRSGGAGAVRTKEPVSTNDVSSAPRSTAVGKPGGKMGLQVGSGAKRAAYGTEAHAVAGPDALLMEPNRTGEPGARMGEPGPGLGLKITFNTAKSERKIEVAPPHLTARSPSQRTSPTTTPALTQTPNPVFSPPVAGAFNPGMGGPRGGAGRGILGHGLLGAGTNGMLPRGIISSRPQGTGERARAPVVVLDGGGGSRYSGPPIRGANSGVFEFRAGKRPGERDREAAPAGRQPGGYSRDGPIRGGDGVGADDRRIRQGPPSGRKWQRGETLTYGEVPAGGVKGTDRQGSGSKAQSYARNPNPNPNPNLNPSPSPNRGKGQSDGLASIGEEEGRGDPGAARQGGKQGGSVEWGGGSVERGRFGREPSHSSVERPVLRSGTSSQDWRTESQANLQRANQEPPQSSATPKAPAGSKTRDESQAGGVAGPQRVSVFQRLGQPAPAIDPPLSNSTLSPEPSLPRAGASGMPSLNPDPARKRFDKDSTYRDSGSESWASEEILNPDLDRSEASKPRSSGPIGRGGRTGGRGRGRRDRPDSFRPLSGRPSNTWMDRTQGSAQGSVQGSAQGPENPATREGSTKSEQSVGGAAAAREAGPRDLSGAENVTPGSAAKGGGGTVFTSGDGGSAAASDVPTAVTEGQSGARTVTPGNAGGGSEEGKGSPSKRAKEGAKGGSSKQGPLSLGAQSGLSQEAGVEKTSVHQTHVEKPKDMSEGNSDLERQESGGAPAGADDVVLQAYRDAKAKKTRIELYVPRRGGPES